MIHYGGGAMWSCRLHVSMYCREVIEDIREKCRVNMEDAAFTVLPQECIFHLFDVRVHPDIDGK